LFIVLAMPASAQTFNRPVEELLDAIDIHIDEPDPHAIKLRLGIGGIVTTRLDASTNASAYPLPFVAFEYHDLLAVDDTQARLNLIPSNSSLGQDGFRAGPMLRIDPGRGNFGQSGIHGLGRIPVSLEAGGFLSYKFGPALLRVRLRQDVTEGHNGATGEIDLRSGLYHSGAFGLGMQLETVWGSRSYMESFFGVTPVQAREARLSPYDLGAGFKDANATLFAEYKFSARWSAIGAVQYIRTLGAAGESPIVMSRGSTDRANVGLFVTYTFGPKAKKQQ
jgi:outer membrane scaffolding protein for murein synthesis (MipA/OmpV family)